MTLFEGGEALDVFLGFEGDLGRSAARLVRFLGILLREQITELQFDIPESGCVVVMGTDSAQVFGFQDRLVAVAGICRSSVGHVAELDEAPGVGYTLKLDELQATVHIVDLNVHRFALRVPAVKPSDAVFQHEPDTLGALAKYFMDWSCVHVFSLWIANVDSRLYSPIAQL